MQTWIRSTLPIGVAIAGAGWVSFAAAAPITTDGVVVERIGGSQSFEAGPNALNANATQVFLDVFSKTPGQTHPVQTTALPTITIQIEHPLTEPGTAAQPGGFIHPAT